MKKMKTVEYENCIICQCKTSVPIDFPVDNRENYVVGLGQLCEKCHSNMQDSQVTDELMEIIDMDALLRRCRKKNSAKEKN